MVYRNNSLDDTEINSNEQVFSDDLSSLNAYTAPTLMPDCEFTAMIRSLNKKQWALFTIVLSWPKSYVKGTSAIYPLNLETLHIFLTGNAGCGKSLSYGNVAADKPNVLLMSSSGVAFINIDGTAIHTAFNIPVDQLVRTANFGIRWNQEITYQSWKS